MHHPLTSVSVTVIHVKNLTNWAKSELTLASAAQMFTMVSNSHWVSSTVSSHYREQLHQLQLRHQ